MKKEKKKNEMAYIENLDIFHFLTISICIMDNQTDI